MRRKRSSLEGSLGVFQDVIMSATGILLMFVFVLILSVALNKYSSSLDAAKENEALLQAVHERQALLDAINSEQAQLKAFVAGEVTQLTNWVTEADKRAKKRQEDARQAELEQAKRPAARPLLADLDIQFYRGSKEVKNPAVMILRGDYLEIWSPSQTSPLRQKLKIDNFVPQYIANKQGAPTPEWEQMSRQVTQQLKAALTPDSDGVILLLTPPTFGTVEEHHAAISTVAEITEVLDKPFTYTLVPNTYTPKL